MSAVAACEVCGNEYDKPITVSQGERTGVFDSFECAAHAMAPECSHCGCRILGHGVEVGTSMYCCANCARLAGEPEVTDRA